MKIETPLQKIETELKRRLLNKTRITNDFTNGWETAYSEIIELVKKELPYEREVIEKSVGIHIGRNNNGILKELSPKQYFEQTFKSE